MLHLQEGPELRMHYWWDRGDKKAQHPAGFEPTTSLSWGVRSSRVLQPPLGPTLLEYLRLIKTYRLCSLESYFFHVWQIFQKILGRLGLTSSFDFREQQVHSHPCELKKMQSMSSKAKLIFFLHCGIRNGVSCGDRRDAPLWNFLL